MAFSPERLSFFKLATVGTPMYDDPETVKNNVLEKKGDEIGVAPTLNMSYEECPTANSTISAPVKATHSDQTFAMQDGTEDEYSGILNESRYIRVKSIYSPLRSSLLSFRDTDDSKKALLEICQFVYVLFLLSSTQNIDNDTFDGHMQLTKDAFTALGQDTTRIDEIGKLFGEDFPPARIHTLKEKLKRGKGAAVKFKQIDKIAVLERKLADVESGVKYVQTEFTHVMTSMEGLLLEMKAIKADIAMQAESSKGKAKWL